MIPSALTSFHTTGGKPPLSYAVLQESGTGLCLRSLPESCRSSSVLEFLVADRRSSILSRGAVPWLRPSPDGRRDVAQLGSAPRLGRGGRRFKSCRPDHGTFIRTPGACASARGSFLRGGLPPSIRWPLRRHRSEAMWIDGPSWVTARPSGTPASVWSCVAAQGFQGLAKVVGRMRKPSRGRAAGRAGRRFGAPFDDRLLGGDGRCVSSGSGCGRAGDHRPAARSWLARVPRRAARGASPKAITAVRPTGSCHNRENAGAITRTRGRSVPKSVAPAHGGGTVH